MSQRQVTATLLALIAVLAGCDDGPTRPAAWRTQILYAADRGSYTQIRVMNADGTNQRQLTFDAIDSGSPSWSRDGTQIVFKRVWTRGVTSRSGLFRMNRSGSNVTCLDSITEAYYGSPRYSPDGTKIVTWISALSSPFEVWLLNADGSNPINLTSVAGPGRDPSWSPDGTRIVYSRATDLGWRIYTMKPDGTDTLKVLETGVANSNQYQPRWSPDGTTIVYVDDHGIHTTTDFTWIDIVNADGTNIRPVTPLTDGIRSEPCWSPDGLKIAYRDDIYPADIVTVNKDGTGAVNVTHDPASYDYSPDWGPAAP